MIKKRPYIEPVIRTIAGGLLVICALFALYYPELKPFWLGFLFFIGINLFVGYIVWRFRHDAPHPDA